MIHLCTQKTALRCWRTEGRLCLTNVTQWNGRYNKKKMLKKGGPDGSLRPGMSMKKLVTNSLIVCPKNVIKIWTFYKKKMKFLMKLLRENYSMGRGMHTAQKNRPAKADGTGS